MKKTSIILAAALVAGLSFAGCKLQEDEGKAFNGETISMTNDGTNTYYRSFVSTATKHYSANAKITISNPTTIASPYSSTTSTGNKANAVYGFLFGLEKDNVPTGYVNPTGGTKTTFYNFGIASFRWNATDGKGEWYVSWCTEVPDTIFGYNNSGAFEGVASDGKTYGKEVQIVKGTGTASYETLSAPAIASDGTVSVMIKTVANDDGSYAVSICDSTGDTKYASATIPAATTGLTAKTQKYIGRYVNIYIDETASGTIEYSDVSGAAIPADYQD